MKSSAPSVESALDAYHQACLAVLDLFQEESDALQSGRLERLDGFPDRRRALLVRLETTQRSIRDSAPRPISESQRARIQAVADLIQRAVRLDRQNEQWWLRHGLLPAGMVPSSATRNPGRVRSTYGFPGRGAVP